MSAIELLLVVALVTLVVVFCAWLGMAGARSTRRAVVIITFVIAWCVGTLFIGVPAYAAGWIIARHRGQRA